MAEPTDTQRAKSRLGPRAGTGVDSGDGGSWRNVGGSSRAADIAEDGSNVS